MIRDIPLTITFRQYKKHRGPFIFVFYYPEDEINKQIYQTIRKISTFYNDVPVFRFNYKEFIKMFPDEIKDHNDILVLEKYYLNRNYRFIDEKTTQTIFESVRIQRYEYKKETCVAYKTQKRKKLYPYMPLYGKSISPYKFLNNIEEINEQYQFPNSTALHDRKKYYRKIKQQFIRCKNLKISEGLDSKDLISMNTKYNKLIDKIPKKNKIIKKTCYKVSDDNKIIIISKDKKILEDCESNEKNSLIEQTNSIINNSLTFRQNLILNSHKDPSRKLFTIGKDNIGESYKNISCNKFEGSKKSKECLTEQTLPYNESMFQKIIDVVNKKQNLHSAPSKSETNLSKKYILSNIEPKYVNKTSENNFLLLHKDRDIKLSTEKLAVNSSLFDDSLSKIIKKDDKKISISPILTSMLSKNYTIIPKSEEGKKYQLYCYQNIQEKSDNDLLENKLIENGISEFHKRDSLSFLCNKKFENTCFKNNCIISKNISASGDKIDLFSFEKKQSDFHLNSKDGEPRFNITPNKSINSYSNLIDTDKPLDYSFSENKNKLKENIKSIGYRNIEAEAQETINKLIVLKQPYKKRYLK